MLLRVCSRRHEIVRSADVASENVVGSSAADARQPGSRFILNPATEALEVRPRLKSRRRFRANFATLSFASISILRFSISRSSASSRLFHLLWALKMRRARKC